MEQVVILILADLVPLGSVVPCLGARGVTGTNGFMGWI